MSTIALKLYLNTWEPRIQCLAPNYFSRSMPSCISAIRYLKLSGIGATNIINTFRAIYWKVIIYITNVKLKDMLGWNIVSTETYNLCIVKNHTLTQLFVKYRCFGITKIIGSKALNSGFPSIQVKFQRYGRHVC
jgi:hypothetical protein